MLLRKFLARRTGFVGGLLGSPHWWLTFRVIPQKSRRAPRDRKFVSSMSSCADLKSYMPAEWELHQCCWMGWPLDNGNWRDGAGLAQLTFGAVARYDKACIIPYQSLCAAGGGVTICQLKRFDAVAGYYLCYFLMKSS